MRLYHKLLVVAGVLMLAIVLGTCVGLLGGCAEPARIPPPSPQLTELPAVNWPTPGHVVTLPAVGSVYTATQEPPVQVPAISDCGGQPTDPTWLSGYFGAVIWDGYGVAALPTCCERPCPAAHVVHVEDGDGEPAAGVAVMWSWAGAPWLPVELHGCPDAAGNLTTHGVYGFTNANGDIGFGMGHGAYYTPPGEVGPHRSWVGGVDGCLRGIGMLSFTDHWHVDAGWRMEGVDRMAEERYTPGATVLAVRLGDGRELNVVCWGDDQVAEVRRTTTVIGVVKP